MDGYPRYEAGDKGQSNPAFDELEDSINPIENYVEVQEVDGSTEESTKSDKKRTEEKTEKKTERSSDKKERRKSESRKKERSRSIKRQDSYHVVSVSTVENNKTCEEKKEKKQDDDGLSESECRHGDCKLIRYCVLVTRHPKRAFCIALSVHIFLAVLMLILLATSYDILPADFSDIPLALIDDEQYLRAQAWKQKHSDQMIHPYLATGGDVDRQTVKAAQIQLAYSLDGDNVFTAQNLRKIQEAEEELMNVEGMENYCLLFGSVCQKPFSIIRFFDGTYRGIDPRLYDPDFQDVAKTLVAASENPATSTNLNFHLGKDYRLSSTEAYSSITRSLIFLATPLKGFRNTEDDATVQENMIDDFQMGKLRDKMYDLAKSGVGDMLFTFISATLYIEDVIDQVILDLCLSVGSCMFIFLFMWFQTRSLFITTFALLSILTSFCGANLLYRIVFGFRFFGTFHVLSIFIILGIGADDIFVFFDTWKFSASESYPSLQHRFSAAYRRAALAMLVTSITTMLAFFVSTFCDLLAVSSFGLFSGLLVLVNYISSITYFPTVVMLYHVTWEKKPLCPCMTAKVQDSDSDDKNKRPPIVRFFAGPYFRFITHNIIRWVIMAFYAIVLIVFVYFATTIEPDEAGVKLWRETTNYGRAKHQQSNAFKPSMEDEVIEVYMVWGLKEQDRSECSRYVMDKKCLGKTVWDNGFDMNPSHAQYALLNFCDELRNLDDETVDRLKIRRDSTTGELEVNCFIDSMEEFFKNEYAMGKYGYGDTFKLPTDKEKTQYLMRGNPAFYDMSLITDRFYRYFEVALSFWLSNRYSSTLTEDYNDYGTMVGESNDILDTRPLGNDEVSDYYYGNRLRYMAVGVKTTLPYGNVGYEQGIPVMDDWEEYFQGILKLMPPSLSGGFQCTPVDPDGAAISNSWHWLKVQKALAWNAMTGIVTGICLACPILILATGNFIVGLLATLTICLITITVVGVIPIGGWKLGVLESLNLALIVGLAVDYVVHLAEGYSRSTARDRKGRVLEMLERVGISVLSGAVTTLGASMFMLFAKILFFMQFGIFMFCTIGFSLLYSLGFFATILAIIGPENDSGSLQPFFSWCRRKFSGREKEDVDCKRCCGKGYYPPSSD